MVNFLRAALDGFLADFSLSVRPEPLPPHMDTGHMFGDALSSYKL